VRFPHARLRSKAAALFHAHFRQWFGDLGGDRVFDLFGSYPLLDEAINALGAAAVQLLESADVDVPITTGVIYPRVVLPPDAADWSEARALAVLNHELAHVKRLDAFTQLLAQAALALHWFNPLAWLAARQMRLEREKACDDFVLAAGARPSEYAHDLLEIVAQLGTKREYAVALAMARKSQFEGRVLALLDPRRNRQALSRAAVEQHKHAKIERDDTVVLSSRIIPGNEKAIYRMIDHLFRREAHVIYEDGSSPPVHVSGHASQEELKLIINLVKPRYFIPIHGEYRQLRRHGEMAAAMHGAVGSVLHIESGDVLEFDELGARKAGKVTVGRICIDSGSRTDVVEDLIIKDRRHLSEDGIVLPIIAINKLTGKVESAPEIVTRGFAVGTGENGFMQEARGVVMKTLDESSEEEKGDYGVIKEKIRADLKRYIVKQTQRRPLIMPVILEV